jgi:hypothetical protein
MTEVVLVWVRVPMVKIISGVTWACMVVWVIITKVWSVVIFYSF